tara:strand:+ start:799 stop:1491 length:693 start_codon:yes stop_codon:yes gene_type:complete
MKNIMIRQPGYFPNIGFFKKIQSSHMFVFLNDVQFSKDSFDNRNQIKSKNNSEWITVPLKRPVFEKKLNEVSISYSTDWVSEHTNKILENYRFAPYFFSYWYEIEKILNKKFEFLIDLNLELIHYFLKILDITTPIINSSELSITKTKTERLIEICSQLEATCYISGIGGKDYLDELLFEEHKIELIYENFIHPKYNQLNGNFLKNMSIIDLLFNEGHNSKKIINESQNL